MKPNFINTFSQIQVSLIRVSPLYTTVPQTGTIICIFFIRIKFKNLFLKIKNYYSLVMDLLGQSLEDLFTLCGRKLTLKSVLMLADQLVSRIEYIHSRYFLHRDIKPDNVTFFLLLKIKFY